MPLLSPRRRKLRCSVDLAVWEHLRHDLTPAHFGALVNALIWWHSWGEQDINRRQLRHCGVRGAAIEAFIGLDVLEQTGTETYVWKCPLLRFDVKPPPTRAPLSQRTRWLVLRRDGHRCTYCGRGPKEVKLHIDHVVPVVRGGTDEIDNLVTACADCNLGKKDLLL